MFGKLTGLAILIAIMAACTTTQPTSQTAVSMTVPVAEEPEVSLSPDQHAVAPLISHYAKKHGIPESLLNRVVTRESRYNPAARNGPYWGLMQIRHDTAQTMGYKGPASGLLDPSTNLEYAGRFLRGAWLLADGSESRAVKLYASGYYYVAKRRRMLCETGLRNCPSKD